MPKVAVQNDHILGSTATLQARIQANVAISKLLHTTFLHFEAPETD